MLRQRPFTSFCLVLTAFFVVAFWQTQTRSTSLLRRVTNTSAEVINLNPSLSGDGSQVAFESTADLAGIRGGKGFHALKANISSDPVAFSQIGITRAVAPAISQDGSRIAFASYEDLVGQNADRNSEIFMLDGSTLTQITKTTPADLASRLRDGNFQPSISDDGAYIAFSSTRNLVGMNSDLNFEIFLYDSASQTVIQLTAAKGTTGATEAKMAGDGSHVAYIQDSGADAGSPGSPSGTTASVAGNPDLMLYDRATGLTSKIASRARALSLTYGRAISDDGLRVVYSAETAENQSQVFLYDGRFDASRQITSLGARADDVPLHATISGDAKRIAFSTRRNVVGGNADRSVELYAYDIPTAQFTQLTDAPSTATAEIVSSLNDAGTIAVFNFPRVLIGSVPDNDLANNSEIYSTLIPVRPASGTITVLNGAALEVETSTDRAIAPASIAIARGSVLASKTEHTQRLVDGSFPLSAAGTTVTVDGRAAPILYVSPTQVNFVVPSETESGPAEVIVTNAEEFQSKTVMAIVPAAPGVFTMNGTGLGNGVILNARTLVSEPFDPSDGKLRLIIFATGVRGSSQLSATVAGHPLTVESIEKSWELPGLDEIHVLAPANLSGVGTVSLVIAADGREGNPVDITFTEGPQRDIVINEILADPPDGIVGDANHDGVRESSQDEFVELVNITTWDLDLSGYQLQTRSSSSGSDILRHRFEPGSVFPAGTAIVLFGSGNPDSANTVFAGAQIFKASTGGLSLSNGGAIVTLRDQSGAILSSMSYGGSTRLRGDANESLTRSADILGSFVLHHTAPGSGGRLFSPGTRLNGDAFLPQPAISRILISPASATVAVDEQVQLVVRALDQTDQEVSGVIFSWRSNNTSVVTVDRNGLANAIAPGIAEITASARGVQSTPSVIVVATPSPTPIPSASPLPSPSPAPTPPPTPSPSPSPTVAPMVVISEFRTRGPNGASDEFIELFNSSDTAVAIGGWKIKVSSNANAVSTRMTLNASAVIPARGHFLASHSGGYSGSVAADQVYSSGIANDGGIALTFANDVVVDQIGLSAGSAFREGMHLAPLPSDANQSYERLPGGSNGSSKDTDNNFNDFHLLTPSDPQNLSSSLTPGPSPTPTPPSSPTPVPTPSLSPSPSASQSPSPSPSPTLTPTPSPSPLTKIVISQVYGGGGNSGSPYRNDFIEIFNSGETSVNLAGWSVQYASATAFTWSVTNLSSLMLAPGQYYLIQEGSGGNNGAILPTMDATGTVAMAATAGKVALVNVTTALSGACPGSNSIVDTVGYGSTASCFRGLGPAPAPSNTTSALRNGNGCTDSQNNASDFMAAPPNPRNTMSSTKPCTGTIACASISAEYRNHWRQLLALL